jgi:endonuclease/exonuclease/phosphatase family metal-dependent hydrolase
MPYRIVCLVVALGCGFSLAAGAQAAAPLRIVAFNVENLTAPGENRPPEMVRFKSDQARRDHIERVATVIAQIRPDICALEEVTSKQSLDALVEALHKKGRKDYVGYHVESSDGYTGFDCSVISRVKLDEVEGEKIRHFGLSDAGGDYNEKFIVKEPNGNVRLREQGISRHAIYYVTYGGKKLGFLGLHLKSQTADPASCAQRDAEAKVARKLIQKEIVARGYQPIVLGDLNDYDPDVPDSDDSLSTITSVLNTLKDYDPKQPGPELANIAEKIPQANRFTHHWDKNENGRDDKSDTYTMIDHILIPRKWMANVRHAGIVRKSDLTTSDHWPIGLDLELR